MTEREIYNQLKQMAINEAVAGFGKESIARNVGMQIDKIIDLALTLSASREGYKLVPLVPTNEMLEALNSAYEMDYEGGSYDAVRGYKAMIGVGNE